MVNTCDFVFIGTRLAQVRRHLGLTQDELAKEIGTSKRGIQDNEANKAIPGGKALCGLLGLGVNVNWLLTGEGPMRLADLVDVSAALHKIELLDKFKAYQDNKPANWRIEVLAENFQHDYNIGKLPQIPGLFSIKTADILALHRSAMQAAPAPAPVEINTETLALMIEGAMKGRPDASPALISRMAVDFYFRIQAMQEVKPEAA